eukprot:gene9202-2990_t
MGHQKDLDLGSSRGLRVVRFSFLAGLFAQDADIKAAELGKKPHKVWCIRSAGSSSGAHEDPIATPVSKSKLAITLLVIASIALAIFVTMGVIRRILGERKRISKDGNGKKKGRKKKVNRGQKRKQKSALDADLGKGETEPEIIELESNSDSEERLVNPAALR